ncbi:MAG: GNAT family N-acetyltransferase [Oscillospiraceae bacterium]|jgi:predicted N-acetyltransferase YhbS|nr:GNAT family N-acetyltransferase [Oscillospiraceae bacterium]
MVEFHLMAQGHPCWEETIAAAESCSWRAGPFLAEKMKGNTFLEWERVCAACVDGKVAGFCTVAEKDELPEKYPFSPFIGFVFVSEQYRGKRLSERMIREAAAYVSTLGYQKLYIMSGETGFYEKYGFVKLGDYETIYGDTDQLLVMELE